ncbi:DUF2088 domain-containing protein [Caproiciproducens sp. NJN-50]|uniref:lactate racemase domain-containing protein n=1 Tax=Acutalibacteraceae TaxID=3082771 RepID=UPI000FFDFB88|nr:MULTISPECIES: lactate racemase domain-containing protein [Acutalibacteraceae]QAT49083.1 DUF2088 domain-containing protein [Caproiciproducens sp. NJN-50]
MSEKYRDSQWDGNRVIDNLLKEIALPRMFRVKQEFDDHSIKNIAEAVHKEFQKEKIRGTIRPGMRIAITAGSRGLDRIQELLKAIVDEVKALGGSPYLVPTMGSHGGGTAKGQKEFLAGMGVTEAAMGVPIRSTMEVKLIGRNEDGNPVYIDRYAAEADGVIVVNRVKPHTNFHGSYESGLMKMMTIGLGKNTGASVCHSMGWDNMTHNVEAFGTGVLKYANILFGIATIENAFDQTCMITGLTPEEIPQREPELLKMAKEKMPRILFPEFDILIVDQIGKNFSGSGMDPNITGVSGNPKVGGDPKVDLRLVLDLSNGTHGNATGLGLADFSTKRVFDKIDFDAGYPNSLTSRTTAGGKIPIILKNDQTAIKSAIFTCTGIGEKGPRIVRIPNTSHIQCIDLSEAMLEEAQSNPRIQILEQPHELCLNAEGNLF